MGSLANLNHAIWYLVIHLLTNQFLMLVVFAVAVWYGVRAARRAPLPPAPAAEGLDAQKLGSLKTMAHIGYGLFMLPTGIAAVILSYLKRDEARGSWLESHFAWQIRTFWFGFLWAVVGTPTLYFSMIGWLILIAAAVWWIYRIVRGWVSLHDGRPMPMKQKGRLPARAGDRPV